MAATQRERVPPMRGYRDSLSAENRQMYDEKLTLILTVAMISRDACKIFIGAFPRKLFRIQSHFIDLLRMRCI